MRDCDEFYQLRDPRTEQYVGSDTNYFGPVHLEIRYADATIAAAQLKLLAIANQAARVHRAFSIDLPENAIPLRVNTPFDGSTLHEVLRNTIRAINPCCEIRFGARPDGKHVSLGIGASAGHGLDWYLGAKGAIAHLSKKPEPITDERASLRGAALGACLGAAALFRSSMGLESAPRTLSAWNYREGSAAERGPDLSQQIDVGRVLMVGAGAVAASLVYWLKSFGVGGSWTIVDEDVVELHNTNRGLVFTPAHSNWPDLRPEQMLSKAALLAALLPSSRAVRKWFDTASEVNEQYDVILCLANARGVRSQVAARNSAVVLHATTGRNWLSELHRHVLSIDDCIWCRSGEMVAARFGCSTATIGAPENSADAALPFLSAASGLMLATSLERLQLGQLTSDSCNDWRWDFGSNYRMAAAGKRQCRSDCQRICPAEVRKRINAGTRWAHLDPGK